MAESGANVAIVYAGNEEAANETCALAAEHGVTAKAYRCDVSDFDATKETVAQILADFGQNRYFGEQRGHHARRAGAFHEGGRLSTR